MPSHIYVQYVQYLKANNIVGLVFALDQGGFGAAMKKTQDSPEVEPFQEFWRCYLRDHARPGTRALHFVGNGVAVAALVLGIVMIDPIIPIVGIGIGYLFAWTGHLLIEHNQPSMLAHPIWSFICDVRMFRLWLGRRLDDGRARPRFEANRGDVA
jgi:hypothetical protein